MASKTYEEWAEGYASRIARCNGDDDRMLELNKIWVEIQRLTVSGLPLNDEQITRMLKALKAALKKLGYDDAILALEYRKGNESYEELAKSHSISNEEMLSMMQMVAKGPKR